MALTRRAAVEVHGTGAFGAAYLLDTWALTRAANATGDVHLQSVDGHHYPTAMLKLELSLMWLLMRLHRRLVVHKSTPFYDIDHR